MYRRFYVGFMLLACGGVCLLAAMAGTTAGTIAAGLRGDEKEPKAKKAKKVKTEDAGCPGQVCPLYMWGNFGTYYSYYAFVCPGPNPVNLNYQDQIVPGGCNDPCNNCVPQLKFKGPDAKLLAAKLARKPHQHDPRLRTGIARGEPITDKAKYIANVTSQTDCTELVPPVLVKIRTKTTPSYTAWAYLYLVQVKPKPVSGGTPQAQVLSTGIEVDPSKVDPGRLLEAVDIPKGDIVSTDGQICTVQYGPVLYEVVLDKNALIDPK
jgi:hypothetical protein